MVDWEEHFSYSEDSPSGLVWVNDRLAGFNNKTVNAYAGDVAGSVNNQGYWMVYHVTTRKSVGCHRVVYEIHRGDLASGMQVDHIDGDRTNNVISNLRAVEGKLNARNQKLREDNTSGVQGVHWNLSHGNKYAVAEWNDLTGEKCQKYFSTKKFGEEEAFLMACRRRKDAIEYLNSIGAGYAARHGAECASVPS